MTRTERFLITLAALTGAVGLVVATFAVISYRDPIKEHVGEWVPSGALAAAETQGRYADG